MGDFSEVDQAWFEMASIRRRCLSDAVWVPLRLAEWIGEVGRIGYEGYRTEFFGLGSIAVPVARRADADKLEWSEIGIGHQHGVIASKEGYTPAEVYQYRDDDDLGIELVLEQSFDGAAPRVWHLNQDLVMALGLLRENDEWIRPSEDYCVVARLRRNAEGRPIACEIKNEFLRDYLAARNMAFRVTSYRKRERITKEANHITWPDGGLKDSGEQHRFEGRVFPILEGGNPADGGYAVFRISRTDVDPEEDVPRPGPESGANTASESWKGQHKGRKLVRITGELWRNEWIEPGINSVRVRGDEVVTGVSYIVDASGRRLPSETLQDENDPRWLWFHPQVVLSLIRHRGGELKWYTQETGGVSCSPAYSVHFGINGAGLITAYAYDIAKLPTWQQQIWAGFNTAPEGGVSRELLSAQMETRVAETAAPEAVLPEVLEALDETFIRRIGAPLFRKHPSTEELISAVHRFRAIGSGGFLALAKDLVRITADRIDAAALQMVVPPPAKEKWGSLKSLEKYLATIMPEAKAKNMISPLVGAYELRIGDAHLLPSDIADAYRLARVDSAAPGLQQGFWLLASVVSCLMEINRSLNV
ncbi:MAG: hypothetical protein ACREE4_02440 [Stellaceae bacterium]